MVSKGFKCGDRVKRTDTGEKLVVMLEGDCE